MKRIAKNIGLGVLCLIEFVAVWFWASPKIMPCNHDQTHVIVVEQATCTEQGYIENLCCWCDEVISDDYLEATGHEFGEFTTIEEPSKNKNGIKSRKCVACDKEEQQEIICTHDQTYEYVVKQATCAEKGIIADICSICDTTVQEKETDMLECEFGSWIYERYATPLKSGSKYKQCISCKKTVYETYTMEMAGKYSVYIEGTDINFCFTVGSMTQEDTDKYDIVYTEDRGADNPFILGHNYRLLGPLYQTDIGDYIYVCLDGKISVYKVVVSEYGLQTENRKDIIGQTTGVSILHNYGCKTLHLYTCYGSSKNGRWIVLAVPV